jgi:hypothetical protein
MQSTVLKTARQDHRQKFLFWKVNKHLILPRNWAGPIGSPIALPDFAISSVLPVQTHKSGEEI